MPSTPSPHAFDDRQIWTVAVWVGLVMGLGESSIYFLRQAAGDDVFVSADILWAAMIFDTAVCLGLAAFATAAARPFPVVRFAVPYAFAFLLFVNWSAVALHERVHLLVHPILAAGLAKVSIDLWERDRGRLARFTGRSLPWLASLAIIIGLAVPIGRRVTEARQIAALPPAAPGAPNVLVLLIDAFRADHSSGYGYHRPTTPRIDAFAEGGTVFERAFATSSYTLASHASLLTGLLPHEHGAEWDDAMEFWDCGCPLLGAVLQERGYATAGFSSNPYWFTREYGFARGFHRFEDFFNTPGDVVFRTTFGRALERLVLPRIGYLDIPGRKDADMVNPRLLRWIDRSRDRPFFAFVNYFDIHDPYLPPEPYRSRFAGKPVGGRINWRITGIDPRLSEAVIQDEVAAYDGAITYVDEQIGALLDALEARGELENTLVVITSDHGEEFGEHGLVLHGHGLHVQSIHVPLIIRGPGVPAGQRITTPVSNAAVPSTVMALTTGESTFPMDPLVGHYARRRYPPIGELVRKPWGSERHPTFHGAMQSVVDGSLHYIRHETFGVQLYDLSADPAEQQDLAEEPEYDATLERLDSIIQDAMHP